MYLSHIKNQRQDNVRVRSVHFSMSEKSVLSPRTLLNGNSTTQFGARKRQGVGWGVGRGKDSEALEEDVQGGTRVHHPSSILDQDSIQSLVTRHPALVEGRLGGMLG